MSVKKVSAKQFEKMYNKNYDEVRTYEENGIAYTVKPLLTTVEMWALVNDVVDNVVNNGDDNTYHPEIFDYVYRYFIISYYTNLTFPKDYEASYKLVYGTKVFDNIKNFFDHEDYKGQFYAIRVAINEKLDYKRAQRIKREAASGIMDDVMQLIYQLDNTESGKVIPMPKKD